METLVIEDAQALKRAGLDGDGLRGLPGSTASLMLCGQQTPPCALEWRI